MAAVSSDEERMDAEMKEIDRSLEELRKRREELLKAKEAIRTGKIPATPKSATPQTSAPVAAPATSAKALEGALNSLEWKSFKKKEGEWSFLRTRDGQLVDALKSETDLVNQLRRGKEIVVGKYRYSVSEDKFLNRFFAG